MLRGVDLRQGGWGATFLKFLGSALAGKSVVEVGAGLLSYCKTSVGYCLPPYNRLIEPR